MSIADSVPQLVSLSEREALLRAQSGFNELNVNDMAVLVSLAHEMYVERGVEIVTEGDLIDAVYILVSGSAEVTRQLTMNNKSGSTLLAILYKGDAIGLSGGQLFSKTGMRTATVTASSPCLLLQLQLEDLKQFLENKPDVMNALHQQSTWMLRMQLIKQTAPFAHLNNEQLAGLASGVKEVLVKADEVLFKEGELADSCYLICSGKIEISHKSETGTDQVLAVLEPYALLGEAAFLKCSRRNATARTLTECTLLLLDGDMLHELAIGSSEVPDTLMTVIQGYCRPIRHENIVYQHRETSDGQKITTLKNGATNSYLQLSEQEWFIWTQLNGTLTFAELLKLLYQEFGISNPDEVKQTIQKLVNSGFASIDSVESIFSEEKNKEEQEKSLFARIINFSYFFKKSDQKFAFLYRCGGFLFFKIPCVLLGLVIIFIGLAMFYKVLTGIGSILPDMSNFPLLVLAAVIVSMVFQLVSSFIKALAIKHFGREVLQFGIVWKKIGPVAVVDASDMWLSTAWSQIIVGFSGIFSNLVIASFLSIYASYVDNQQTMLFVWLSALFIYLQSIRSLDPALDADGYNVLSLLLDCSRLRELAMQWMADTYHNVKKMPVDKTKRSSDEAYRTTSETEHSETISVKQSGIISSLRKKIIIFWGYTLGYLLLILLVMQLLLNNLLAEQQIFPFFNLFVPISLVSVFLIEISLGFVNLKRQGISQGL